MFTIQFFCRNVINFFQNKPSPFKVELEADCARLEFSKVLETCFLLLKAEPIIFRDLWDWSELVDYGKRQTLRCEQQLYFNHIVAIVMGMDSVQLNELNSSTVTDTTSYLMFEENLKKLKGFNLQRYHEESMISDGAQEMENNSIIYSNILCCDYVTQIEGVFLTVYNKDNYRFYSTSNDQFDQMVPVDSTRSYLRSLALAVNSGKAVCLSGPVGCGKTSLIEYLAKKTGRVPCKLSENLKANDNTTDKDRKVKNQKDLCFKSPNKNTAFYRIQLGDQTDSKVLLGQYNCADVPGEFIWLPGILTQVSSSLILFRGPINRRE